MLLEDNCFADLNNWPVLVSFLPTARGVSGPETLLRILLIHLANGCSLAETAARARNAGLGEVTAVAVFKRLLASEHWDEAAGVRLSLCIARFVLYCCPPLA